MRKSALLIIVAIAALLGGNAHAQTPAPEASATPPALATPAPDPTNTLPLLSTDGPSALPTVEPTPFELIRRNSRGIVVLRIQDRLLDLDYFHFKSTGSFGTMTHSAVMQMQEFNQLMADGSVGEETRRILFSDSVSRNPIPDSVTIPIGPGTRNAVTEFGIQGEGENPWEDSIKKQLKLSFPYRIKDLYTNTVFNITYVGGQNHAHVVPTTVVDIARFEEIRGAESNWNKRPVLVTIDNVKYAASLQCQPHGVVSVASVAENGFSGYLCLYFSGSRSDILNMRDEEHNRTILRAAGVSE